MKNFRKAAFSTICMLMVAVLSLTGATYAWFTAGEQATVEGMNVKVTAAEGGIQVRLDNTATWMTTLDLNVEADNIAPVSSKDGKTFFKLGEINPANSAQAKVVSVEKEDNNDIIIRKIELSNPGQNNITVDLDGSSIVKAANGTDNEIYKAARVALIVTKGGAPVANYVYAAEVDTWYAFTATSDAFVDVNAAVENIAVSTTTTAVDSCTIELKANPDHANSDEIVDVEIVIWLEGQDTDCSNGNAAGAFDIRLNFKDVTAE